MKRITSYSLAGFIILLSTVLLANPFVPGKKQDHPILLRGGDLYTVAGGVQTQTDLLFENGRIVQIGKNLTAPPNAEVINAAGKRVYPGLIDAASTLGLTEIGAVRATNDMNEVGDVTPEVIAHIAYNTDSELGPTVRSNGVLLALVAPRGGVISGRSSLMNLDGWTKEDAAEKLEVGLHINWPQAAISTAWWMEQTPEEQKKQMAEQRENLRAAFRTARAYYDAKKAGTLTATDLRWDAMTGVFDKTMPVFVNADDVRQIEEAVHFAKEFDVRLVVVGGNEAYRAAALLKTNNVPVILGRTHRTPPREDDDYDIGYKMPKLLADAGVKFCFSYSYSGWASRSLPFQAAQAVAFGLDPATALRALTLTSAEILGVDQAVGSLEVGKKATLIVSDGDVLDPITNRVTHAWIEGRVVGLNNRHKALYEKYRQKAYPAK